MTSERSLYPMGPGKVRAEWGPMRLVLEVWRKKKPDDDLAWFGGRIAFQALEDVGAEYRRLQAPSLGLKISPRSRVAAAMLQATRAFMEPDLTPIAAVAGSIADQVADWLVDQGAEKAIVDNGGDIAIRLSPDSVARVGLQALPQQPEENHTLYLHGRQASWGVATSGLGGRSLTKGIASSVTVLAQTAAAADAAATAVANACTVDDARILRIPAQSVDPASDLGEDLVIMGLEPLEDELWNMALERAMAKAERYLSQGWIFGAYCVAGPLSAWTSSLDQFSLPPSGSMNTANFPFLSVLGQEIFKICRRQS
ncbi:MAG: FAD:protein FMN transferase [Desulfovermiculus sp.]|nr:FAD:protein FMN transferase [Desulfovermiculus sp.]